MFTSTSDHPIFECPSRPLLMERRWKSTHELAPNCPRCSSSNTKFCYYNNYSLSQPRYFCKGCRRYWTKGGSLRNVPVGGGCRKSRRSKSARQKERLGLNYHMPSPGSTSNDSDSSAADGVNIDLAAIFSKFLNQDSSSDEKVVTDQESSNGASSTSLELSSTSLDTQTDQMENIMLETQLQLSDLIDFGDNFHDHDQGPPQLCLDDENIQKLLGHNALEFQDILGDDDIGWSEGTSLPNFELQNLVQFQDIGPISMDDHTKFASNIACENWSSLDLLGYEIFSRP